MSILMFEKEPDLLTNKQVQNLFSVGKNTILKLISSGYLPASISQRLYIPHPPETFRFPSTKKPPKISLWRFSSSATRIRTLK